MVEELYNSKDFCRLVEQYEELEKENAELTADKNHLIQAAMDGGDKYHYTAHDIAYRDLERKCKALEAENAELEAALVSSGNQQGLYLEELFVLRKRIAELEAAQRWIPVSERLPEDGEVVWHIDEYLRKDVE